MPLNPSVILAIVFITAIFIVAMYDLYATSAQNDWPTVSSVIVAWSSDYPILPFLIGMLIGHLFWRPR